MGWGFRRCWRWRCEGKGGAGCRCVATLEFTNRLYTFGTLTKTQSR